MGQGIGNATGQLQQLGNAAQQADRQTGTLEARTASTGEQFSRLALGIGSAASGVLNLVRSYTGLHSAQVRVESMALREERANARAETARRALAVAIEEYGANSQEAADATEDLRLAEEAVSVAAGRHEVAQTNLNQRIADFAISIVPSAISIVAGLVQTFDILTRSTQAAGQASLTSTLENTAATIQSTGATLNATSATEIDTAATLEGVAAQLESTGATAQNTAAQISNTGALNTNAAASARSIGAVNGLAAAQVRAGTAATGMGLRMKAALIGTGIGAVLVALGGFLLAFSHNWFGVRDAVNAAGKALGDIFPWLRGVLEMLKEAGIWMSRLFGVGIPEGLDESAEGLDTFGDAASKATDKIKELQKTLVDKIFTGQEAVAEALNIKLKDPDKIIKQLHNMLPDKIQKDIEASVKLDLNMKTAAEGITNELWAAIGSAKIDDSEMDKVVEKTMKFLADKFPNHSQSRLMQEKLAETISGTDTKDKVAALIEAWDATPIAVEISPENINSLITGISGALTETPFAINVVPNVSAEVEAIGDEALGLVLGEKNFTQKLIDTLNQNLESLKNAFKNAGVNAAGAFQEAWNTAVNWGQEFINWIDTHFPGVIPTLKEWGSIAGGAFMLGIQALTDFGAILYKWIDEQTGGQLSKYVETGKKIGENIWKGITEFKPSVDLASPGLILGGQAAFGQTASGQENLSGDFVQINNQIIQEPPDTSGWQTWKDTVNEAIMSVQTTARGFTITMQTYFGVTIPQALTIMSTTISQIWNTTMIAMSSIANTTVLAIVSVFGGMVQNVSAGMIGLANTWSAIMNSMGANAQSGASQVNSAMNSMLSHAEGVFDSFLGSWSDMTADMVTAMEDAVDDINSALDNIEDEEVIIRAKKVGFAEGGILNFAKGGIMESAASGKFFTANGERQITVGDNPGGRETVAFIPHNDPGPIVEKIARMFGGFGNGVSVNAGGTVSVGSGDTHIHQVFINGEEFQRYQVRTISKRAGSFR